MFTVIHSLLCMYACTVHVVELTIKLTLTFLTLTVHFLEISIAFVLKLYSLNIIKKKIKNRIESRACESKSNRDI